MADARWIVHTKGAANQRSFEIAVLRENNRHGIASYGWFGSDKLLISHNGGPCDWPVTSDTWDALLVAARTVADKLNATALGVGGTVEANVAATLERAGETPEDAKRMASEAVAGVTEAPASSVRMLTLPELVGVAEKLTLRRAVDATFAVAVQRKFMEVNGLAAAGVRVPDDSATVQQIDAPDAGPMPGICEDMEKPDLWAYAHLCGWRAAGVALPLKDQSNG